MNARTILLVGLTLALAACTRSTRADGGAAADPDPATETPSGAEAAAPGEKAEPPAADAGEATLPTELQEWRVHDNGTRCMTFPCPSWTAEADGQSVKFTGLDLSPLHLTEGRAAEVRKALYRGEWIIRGRLVGGPMGPAGQGRVMQVVELVRKAPPKE